MFVCVWGGGWDYSSVIGDCFFSTFLLLRIMCLKCMMEICEWVSKSL